MARLMTRTLVAIAIAALALPAPLRATDVDGPNDCLRPNQDFGDAPEGTAVLAYPGIPGRFPTCITPGPIGTQTVACIPISTAPGLTGYVQHSTPAGIPVYWLGCGAAAPMGIDSESDGKVNNSAILGAPSACSAIATDCVEAAFGLSFGQDECVGGTDAGLVRANLRTCKPSTVTFRTTNCATAARTVYLNILVDMNRDGDWNDNYQCPGSCAYEWAVKNVPISLPVGCATLTSPAFLCGPNPGQAWMRLTLSDTPVNDDFPWAGSATMGGLQGGETEDYPVVIRKPATVTLVPLDIDWATVAQGTVRFQLTFRNDDPYDQSEAATGQVMSQRFGVFQPDFGPIGTFNVPPLQPSSFFDVFVDVPLDQLPPTALEILPWGGMAPANAGPASPTGPGGCPPDDHWDGNVDVNWSSPSGSGQVNKHIGTIQVCPSLGNSYIHALVFCSDAAGASWSITGLCPGWSATLVNEGPPLVPAGPAPNPVPPGWTGFICISADASVPPGAVCPLTVTFTCNGVDGVIDLRPVACDCTQQLCDVQYADFGDAPEEITAYTTGVVGLFPTCTAGAPAGDMDLACAPISAPPGASNGYVKHDSPASDALKFWLGCATPGPSVDSEGDGKVNGIGLGASVCAAAVGVDCAEPAFGGAMTFGQDECWGDADAGVPGPLTFRTCRPDTFDIRAFNCTGTAVTAYLNVLVDWNGDGDWNDNMQCAGACTYEWSTKNRLVVLTPGCNVLKATALPGPTSGQAWMRVTITASPVPDDFPWNGSAGLAGGVFRGGETEDYPVVIRKRPTATLNPADIGWLTPSPGIVRFHLTFRNDDPNEPTEPASGQMMSQRFGVFQPDYGPIGTFNVPPIAASSFFDVFFDVSLDQLPPTALEILPWGGMAPAKAGRAAAAAIDTCPPDDHWDGNVDVNWSSPSGGGQVNKHIGTIQVCPARGYSYIHALVFCGDPAGATWSITGLCPGWSATLVDEGPPLVPAGPAPNPVPPGWTGFIAISADASVLPGATCPLQVTFTCNGVDGVIDLEPVACNCGQQVCDIVYRDFGDAPEEIAAYSSGVSGHFPTCIFPTGPGTQTTDCGAPPSTPPGPTGYVVHVSPATAANKIWLGCGLPGAPGLGVDSEANGKVNIDPPFGAASVCDPNVLVDCFEPAWLTFGQDECYGTPDAAIASPMTFRTCRDTVVEITAYNCGTDSVDAHLNVLVDWNEDGDWNDVLRCSQPVPCRPEWVLKNGRVRLGPGCNTLKVPVRAGPRAGQGWMRVTLTVGAVADDFPWNGSLGEPNLAYVGGETEDYPVRIAQSFTDAGPVVPGELGFAPLTPNPSRDGTSARFTMPRDGDASLVVYDVTGRTVRVLLQRYMPAGEHHMLWDFRDDQGRTVPAGLYLIKLKVGQDEFARRVIRLN